MIASNAFAEGKKHDPYERLDAFAQVLNAVEANYVDKIDRTKVIDGAIDGMIRALDPHSSFMSATQRRDFELRTGGSFVGVGIEVGVKEGELRVITAIGGGPAQKAGIMSGDTILAVNGEEVAKMSLDALSMKLRGEPGTTLTLTIRHPNVLAPKTITLTREIIKTELTFSKLIDVHYGYVRLKSFGPGSAEKVRSEIEKLEKMTKGDLRGLVLDLRQNPGGYIKEATELADLFLSSGKIVETRGRDGVAIQTYTASSSTPFKMPLAVLIDNGSASASEILAGALQSHKRAIIVGTTSFGKASVQNILTLKDGSSLKLTIGRYYTPDGRSIQAQGISPDIYVESHVVLDAGEVRALREADLPNALPNGQEPVQRPQISATGDDIQLYMAFSALYGLEVLGK